MTQQPYAPPGYPPQAPPQQYAPPQYPQAPQPYGQPVYQQPYPPQPQAPAQQPAQGSLDAFYGQPSGGGGPSLSWSANGQQKPIGTTYVGIVARDVTHADIQQDSDPQTNQLKTYRDGRPKFYMKVPLKQVLTGYSPQTVGPDPQQFPEGEGTWYVRGQSRDELVRAMAEAGINDPNAAPKAGDVVSITLVDRRASRGQGMPANVVQVRYVRDGATGASSPAPVAAAQPVQPEQPQYQQPPVAVAQSVPQGPPPEWAQPAQQAPVAPQAPAQGPTPPADLDEAQQALLKKLTGG